MEQVIGYYKNFVKEGFDENGILNKFELDCPDNFNFGYDIIDKYGEIDTTFHIHSFQSCPLRRRIFLRPTVSKRTTR